MSSPLDRLLAETIPTRPAPAPKPASEPWTPEEQAQHLADLLEALDGWTYNRDHRDRPHLRLIDTRAATPAA